VIGRWGGRGPAVMSVVIVLLGVVLVIRTIQVGVGGGLGLLIGGLLIVGGALRLWLVTRT
jgi:hypothetical protein